MMSIRLNKALRELNIGFQTAVEFLEKRSDIGEEKLELTSKISDAQYSALVEAFKQDAAVRNEAERLLEKKTKDKKRAPEAKDTRAESLLESSSQQQYKPLGKIDLDSIGKPVAKPSGATEVKGEPKPMAAAVSLAKEETVSQPAPKTEPEKPTPAPVEKPKEVKAGKPAEAAVKASAPNPKPVVDAPAKPKKEEASQSKADSNTAKQSKPTNADNGQQAQPKVFQLKSEKKMLNAPKVNVLGKIDLDALNQSTLLKKNSK